MTEYEFTMQDGSKRYEFCENAHEMHQLRKMHGAVSARPLTGEMAELYEKRMAEKQAARDRRAA